MRTLPGRERRGVGQTWLFGAEKAPPTLELTHPTGKVFKRPEMTGPRNAKTDVEDKIKPQEDQARGNP